MKIIPATDKAFAYFERDDVSEAELPVSEDRAIHFNPRASLMSGISIQLEEKDLEDMPEDLKKLVNDGNVFTYE